MDDEENEIEKIPERIPDDNKLIDRKVIRNSFNFNNFGIRVFKDLPFGDKNHVFSPVNLFASFAMLTLDTDRESRKELERFLVFYNNVILDDNVFSALQSVLQMFAYERRKLRPNYQIFNAIRILIDKRSEFSEKYKNLVKRYINTDIDKIDFQRDWDVIERQIDEFVKIELDSEDIHGFNTNVDRSTQLIILSAVRFNSKWEFEFPSNQIKDEFFYTENDRISVQMMAILNGSWKCIILGEWDSQLIEIPFARKSLSFLLILPSTTYGMAKLMDHLEPQALHKAMTEDSVKRKCNIFLPKFKLECDYDFAKQYHNLQVFSTDRHLTQIGGLQRKFKANNVLHKVVFEISNSGLYPVEPEKCDTGKPRIIRADHPFMFMVKDNRTDTWVFIGAVHSP